MAKFRTTESANWNRLHQHPPKDSEVNPTEQAQASASYVVPPGFYECSQPANQGAMHHIISTCRHSLVTSYSPSFSKIHTAKRKSSFLSHYGKQCKRNVPC